MIKGREGIALVLAIVFMLALTILLTAVLLLSTQEINATQLYLDGNKALYYAEAGVEYAQARILKAVEDKVGSETINETINDILNDISNLEIFRDNNIKETPSLVVNEVYSGAFVSTYSISCAVKYGKAFRKIIKKIQFLDKRLDKAVASAGDAEFKLAGQTGKIEITGDVYATKNISGNNEDRISIIGDVYSGNYTSIKGVSINGNTYPYSDANFQFPLTSSIVIADYKRLAKYYIGSKSSAPSGAIVFETVEDFIKAFNSSTPPSNGVVFVDGDFHINNLSNISLSNLTFVINGNLTHANNVSGISVISENSAVEFIAKEAHFNNISNIKLKNCIIYTTEDFKFNNDLTSESVINLDGGGIYLSNPSEKIVLDISAIKGQLYITSLTEAMKKRGLENYFLVSWSDAGV